MIGISKVEFRKLITDFRKAYPLGEGKYESGMYMLPINVRGKAMHNILVWYPTPGCQWASKGGCTMCNFGENANEYSSDEIVDIFAEQLERLDRGTRFIHLGPGGSVFRPKELQPAARRKIFALFKKFPFLEYVGAECRADAFREADIHESIQLLPPQLKEFSFGFGLESANEFIREYSVHKGSNNKIIEATMQRIIDMRPNYPKLFLSIDVYVLLKPPFLSEREAISDAIESIEWAFAKGADTVTLFPNTIKTNTLCEYLHQQADFCTPLRYETPYFYSVIEVLQALPTSLRNRVVVLGMTSGMAYKLGPRGCDLCTGVLFGLISAFNYSKDPLLLNLASSTRCTCRDDWLQELRQSKHDIQKELPLYFQQLQQRFYSQHPQFHRQIPLAQT